MSCERVKLVRCNGVDFEIDSVVSVLTSTGTYTGRIIEINDNSLILDRSLQYEALKMNIIFSDITDISVI